ncbi:MAG: sensor domain-containing diguanylate cyclase [Pyrinomonadaceae bacterium]
MKHVILIADSHERSAPALLEALRQAGVSASVTACVEALKKDESALLPFAVLYEVAAGEDVSELRAAVEQAASLWPNTPLVACHRSQTNGHGAFEQKTLDRATLERMGFRAVADQPAQLPALLRELEERGMTGELRLPKSLEDVPEKRAPLLPHRLKAKDLRAAFDVVAMLHFVGNQKGAAQTALDGLSTLVRANRWTIYLTSEVRGVKAPSLELLASHRSQNEENGQESLRAALIGETADAKVKETASARKAAARLEIVRRREEALCVLALPLVSGERIIGVLEAVREGEGARTFSRSETELLGALAVPVACALANSVRIAEAERLSLIDDLTKLHNGRYLRQFLVNEIKRARRYSSSVAALFLDLDDFKSINDMHGHLVGSHALVEVAAVILQSIRDTDMVARYGGDEFVIVLPETTIEQAAVVAERMREKIAEQEFTGGRRLRLHLTASFGVAAFPRHAASPQQLIACADTAMYEAKAARKNCVRFSAETVEGKN